MISLKVRSDGSVHGNWVEGDVLGGYQELCDMSGVPVSPYASELPKPNAHTTSLTESGAGGMAAARDGAVTNGSVNGNGVSGHFQGGVI